MQFREVTWAQQLYYQRLLHGPGAEVTERRCVCCVCTAAGSMAGGFAC